MRKRTWFRRFMATLRGNNGAPVESEASLSLLLEQYRWCLAAYLNTPLFRDKEDTDVILRIDRFLTDRVFPNDPKEAEACHQSFKALWLDRRENANWPDAYRTTVRTFVNRCYARMSYGIESKELVAIRLEAFLQGLKVSQGYPAQKEHTEEHALLEKVLLEDVFPDYNAWQEDGKASYVTEITRTPRDEKDEDRL